MKKCSTIGPAMPGMEVKVIDPETGAEFCSGRAR